MVGQWGVIVRVDRLTYDYPKNDVKIVIQYDSGKRESYWLSKQELVWVHREIDTSEDN
jgi:hypothetical protein